MNRLRGLTILASMALAGFGVAASVAQAQHAPNLRLAVERISVPDSVRLSLPLPSSSACDTYTFPTYSVSIHQGRITDTFKTQPCESFGWATHNFYRFHRNWITDLTTGSATRASIELGSSFRSGRLNFTYKALALGKVRSSGKIRVHASTTKDRSYYQGSDEFVNVCINENYTIRSQGGRLYCTVPGTRTVTWKITKDK